VRFRIWSLIFTNRRDSSTTAMEVKKTNEDRSSQQRRRVFTKEQS
jgi:hypothetical protein